MKSSTELLRFFLAGGFFCWAGGDCAMSKFLFGEHDGHLHMRADQIARKYGAAHVNYIEPDGRRRGWFCCPDRGSPLNENCATTVLTAIERAGGFAALTYKQDRA
jgi:hypothetical protein